MNAGASANPIDASMERASRALAEARYFEGAALCVEALRAARAADDFGRMARICLPLQEARRWVRQEALDAGAVRVVSRASDLPGPIAPGCYLVQPPLVGVDARRLREQAWGSAIPVFVLCREPMTAAGQWPIVGVGERVARVRIDPPNGVVRAERAEGEGSPRSVTGDRMTLVVSPEWFAAAGEALGDMAIAQAEGAAEPGDPAPWVVDDFLDLIEACPEHEKFMQALARACRAGVGARTPRDRRRRRGMESPHGF